LSTLERIDQVLPITLFAQVPVSKPEVAKSEHCKTSEASNAVCEVRKRHSQWRVSIGLSLEKEKAKEFTRHATLVKQQQQLIEFFAAQPYFSHERTL